MKTVYRVLAYAIAALVAVQAAAIGYAVFAQLNWIEDGGTLDEAAFDTGAPGTGGHDLPRLDGGVVLLLSLALLIVSFFAKIPQGVRWAVIVLVVHDRPDRLGRSVAPAGRDRCGAWCGRTGPLRSCRDGSDAGAQAGRRRGDGASERRLTATPTMASRSTRVRLVVSVLATVVILAPLAWLWQSSLVGKSYSVMGMGTLDYGGGPVDGHGHGSTDRSITDLVVDRRPQGRRSCGSCC